MSTYQQALIEEINKNTVAMRAILDNPRGENGTLSAEQQASLEASEKDFDRLTAEQARVDELVGKIAHGETTRALLSDVTSAVETPKPTAQQEMYDTIRSYLHDLRDDNRKHPEERWFDIRFDDRKVTEASRAITDFGNNLSLYIDDFSTTMAIYQRTASPLLGVASVITADNGRPLRLPTLSADPTTVSPGESTAITENSGTQGSATATPLGYKTLSYISNEVEDDELVGILGIIAKAQGRSLGIYGGTAMSASLLTAAANGGTANGLGGAQTAAFFGYEDLIDLKMSRAVPYRNAPTTGWLMSNGAIKKVRKFTDKNGQYLWQPAIAQGQPALFDGDPIYEDPGLATPASATKSVLYGDLSAWVIKQRPLRVAVSTEFKFDTDQVAVRSVWRVGGALNDSIAIAYLVSANS